MGSTRVFYFFVQDIRFTEDSNQTRDKGTPMRRKADTIESKEVSAMF